MTNSILVNYTPRHFRYLFFVDVNIRIEELKELMKQNMSFWGGRFNPIVPAKDGEIDSNYIELIRWFDPDIIYYSDGININPVTKFFNPYKYEKLHHADLMNLHGVDCRFLIRNGKREKLLFETGYLYKSKYKDIVGFYELNFGIDKDNYNDHRKFDHDQNLILTEENFGEINSYMFHEEFVYKSQLSRYNAFTFAPKSEKAPKQKNLTVVLADENNELNDLLFFWNSELYRNNEFWIAPTLFVTSKELHLLAQMKDFKGWLGFLSRQREINFISRSLNNSELKKIVHSVFEKFPYLKWSVIEPELFPYKISKYQHDSHSEQTEFAVMHGKNQIFKLSHPSFISSIEASSEKWICDIQMESEYDVMFSNQGNKIKWPSNYPISQYFESQDEKRVNKIYDISIVTGFVEPFCKITSPSDRDLILGILSNRRENSKNISLDGTYQLSSDGKKIQALFSSFVQDWSSLEAIIDNKFWFDIFRSISLDRKNSNIAKGKGIFSFKDLEKEHRLLFEKQGYEYKDVYWHGDDEEWVVQDLQKLIDLGIIIAGCKVKCKTCSAHRWYSFSELSDTLTCKGCYSNIRPNYDTSVYYKVSEIIRSNLVSDETSNSQEIHGNFVVMKTLFELKTGNRKWNSFFCLPPLAFHLNEVNGDIDLIGIQDGLLFIGEAKVNSNLFATKDIENLILLGNYLKPDVIILSYMKGNEPISKAEKIRKAISHECEIRIIQIPEPDYSLIEFPTQ